MTEEYLVGEVLTTFFENPQNFYKVMLVRVIENNCSIDSDEIVVTGIFGQIHQDSPYKFMGKVVTHPKYGQQFSVTSYQQNQPTGEKGLIAYFSSGRFPGIGIKTAEKIVETLGENAIDAIIDNEESLKAVPGLNEKKATSIREIIIANQGTERMLFELTNLGLTALIAQKIIAIYKEKTSQILHEDPYQFLQTIEGLGFRRLDAIAMKLEIQPDDIHRLKGAIFVVIREVCYQLGHTYLLDKDVISQTQRLLETTRAFLIEPDQIVEALNELIREGVIISEEQRLSLASLFYAEVGIVNAVNHITGHSHMVVADDALLEEAMTHAEQCFSIQYDESQRKALKQIMKEPVFLLTGGPGTGKTTIINGVVAMYRYIEHKKGNDASVENMIQLAAPTGRAAKRMNELTGLPASTIHRLLGLLADESSLNEEEAFMDKEVSCDFLIVDEMSMVDTWLMNRLMKAVSPRTKLLFVGDKNQLPSVGPGQVLDDLLRSKRIPSIELTHVHRQKGESSIIPLAHAIKDGYLPKDFLEPQKDRSFLPCRSSQLLTVIEQIVTRALKKGYTKKDIQVLAPMYKGEAGINEINKMMQNLLNPKSSNKTREIESFDRVFRVGDKVLQLVNVAEKNVYNGDMGEITAIIYANENEDQVDKVYVSFDHVEMAYTRQDLIQLTHAYCCSIHKAQGSEFKMVILPMVVQYNRMLRRNLLYTAVTRSKQFLIMCGQYDAFQEAVSHESEMRQTYLVDLLTQESFSKEHFATKSNEKSESVTAKSEGVLSEEAPFIDSTGTVSTNGRLTEEEIMKQLIDPMIGMEDITPYQFMK